MASPGEPGARRAPNRPLTIGRYVLCRELASGGMATVHLARVVGAAGFSRAVAVKRLHPQFARDPEFVTMFTDEARLASRIRHPNVVPTIDVVSHRRELFLVMEFVHGLTLSKLARSGGEAALRLSPSLAASIMVGVLSGLHAAHEATNDQGGALSIVHRDVSPQNIMIDAGGVARLLDFGVAKAASRLQTTEEGRIKGKIAYMSPEQLEGLAVDRRTDVYAAAIVLWELLTGERLYSTADGGAALGRILAADVPKPSSRNAAIPAALDAIVLRGLRRDKEERYASAREMADALSAAVAPAPALEVAAWLLETAGRSLREQAEWVTRAERGEGMDDEADAEDVEEHATSSTWHVRRENATPETVEEPPPTRRRLGLASVLGAIAVAAAVSGALALRAVKSSPPMGVAPEAATNTAFPAAPSPPLVPPASGDAPAPSASTPAIASASPLPVIAPAALPAATKKSPSSAARSQPPRAPPARCDPPYFVTEKGIHVPKPECL